MNEEKTTSDMSDEDSKKHSILLDQEQARVMGCLMEKQLTTPNNYPLTINSLMLACNQKSNREPVMNLTEGRVEHIVRELEEMDLAEIEFGGRAKKVTHKALRALAVDRKEQAILAILMLRAPMTLNDIKARTDRAAHFESVEEVKRLTENLMHRQTPLVICLPKGQGRREDRYSHLLCGPISEEQPLTPAPKPPSHSMGDERLDQLEARISALEARIEELAK